MPASKSTVPLRKNKVAAAATKGTSAIRSFEKVISIEN